MSTPTSTTARATRTSGGAPAQIGSIAVLGYEACSEQDTITPLEIFKGAAMVTSGQIAPWEREAANRELDVRLVSLEPGVVKMQMGTNVVADSVLNDDDLFDILYIPGGVGSGALLTNDRVHKLIRRHHEAGKVIAANCSGVGVIARSGIVNDEPLTCVAAVARGLRGEGFNVALGRRMWIANTASRIWTFTGSYGVNGGAVAMVAHYFGREVGTIVSMMFDTIGGIGDAIFEETGPEFYQHPELEESFQNFFQPMLFPPLDESAEA
ncbi:DJ-1/PfpI family protein [Streptomyces gibsoniae]|uniref:DJ-1/PfpI family protein n=1 Tax=Streptomyces gibsoniae TaxID=3075529 RepID=A0ABU2TVM1_9ACTN|nr:DJ-1/PfpI family protein [Streptomyces sp. DSM 41699]MDT0465017.1 DJ-1/PfpI family protein [Streptomyces sp. DSM 41699]